MTTFSFKKPIEDIEEPTLLPEDWYAFRIEGKGMSVQDNQAKKDGKSEEEGAGSTFAGFLSVTNDVPENNGRQLPLWLSWPSDEDENRRTRDGMKVYDAKMKRIVEFVEAFRGDVDGADVSVDSGAIGSAYVIQKMNRAGTDLENAIDIYSGFKRVDF